MKTKGLLLCLFALFALNIGAASEGRLQTIRLVKNLSQTTPKGKRSIDFMDVSACFNNESLVVQFESNYTNIGISVISLLTNEVVYSESYPYSKDIVLDIAGLLTENEIYRLEITIGETVLYGDFSL